MCLHLSFLVLSERKESTSFSLLNQFLASVFRRLISASFTRHMWKFTNLQDRKTNFFFRITVLNKIIYMPWIYWIMFLQLGQIASPLLQLPYYHQLETEKIVYHKRVHRGFISYSINCFKLLPTKFPCISGSELILHLCPASSVSWSITATILILNMKSCLLHYTSTLKIKVSVQHTQYPKALITSSLHIGQVRWSKSQGSMHVLWKMCLKKQMPFRTYHESHTLFLQMMCKLLH